MVMVGWMFAATDFTLTRTITSVVYLHHRANPIENLNPYAPPYSYSNAHPAIDPNPDHRTLCRHSDPN